jgi:YVTN family beta-propeller protein
VRVLVTNEDSGDLVVVDPEKASILSTIHVGKRPRSLKVAANEEVYVTLSGTPRPRTTNKRDPAYSDDPLPPVDRAADGVGVVDLSAGKLVRTLQAGQDPTTLDLAPDGKTLYVSNEESAAVTVLDLPSGTVRGKVDVCKEPQGVTARADGKVVYVVCKHDNALAAIDVATLKMTAKLSVGRGPRSVMLSRDGKIAVVTDEGEGMLSVVDVAGFTAAGTIKVNEDSPMPSGPRPWDGVFSPDGGKLYVSCGRGGSVSVVDVAERKQVASIDGVGDRPWGIGLHPDGKRLYVANGPMSFDVSVIDLVTGNVEKRAYVGGTLVGLAVVAP